MASEVIFIAKITITSSMAVLYATIGEIFTERSGILNLGVEGMMLMGALTGFGRVSRLQLTLVGGASSHTGWRDFCRDTWVFFHYSQSKSGGLGSGPYAVLYRPK